MEADLIKRKKEDRSNNSNIDYSQSDIITFILHVKLQETKNTEESTFPLQPFLITDKIVFFPQNSKSGNSGKESSSKKSKFSI